MNAFFADFHVIKMFLRVKRKLDEAPANLIKVLTQWTWEMHQKVKDSGRGRGQDGTGKRAKRAKGGFIDGIISRWKMG